MPELVALDLPGGEAFVRALLEAWDRGDAVAPLDRRLRGLARRRQLQALAPTWLVTPSGRRRLPGGSPVETGDALVLATSGSTGEPKGVVLTHEAVAASAAATSERLEVDPARHRWLACLPLNHVGGLSVVTRALLTGTALYVMDGFRAGEIAAAAQANVLVSLVPTALGRLAPAAANGFYRILVGGSATPEHLGPNVVRTYGMTETGSGVVYEGVPLRGVELDISRHSEIRVRGPMILRAYRDGTVPLTADGWFATGDVGRIDGEGRLDIEGRLTDMVVTGGENVWPLAVERVLRRHPGVVEVAVSSRPDPEWGEVLVACVLPTDPASPPSLSELRELVREELAPFAAPRELLLVHRLPKSAVGKLLRDDVRRTVNGVLGLGAPVEARSP